MVGGDSYGRPMTSLLTARQSAVLLAAAGVSRSRAREVLATGLAGPGLRTSNAVLYDAARVGELAARPVLRQLDLEALFPRGLVVGRRAVDVSAAWVDQAAGLTDGWRMSTPTAIWLAHQAEQGGPLPFVATVSGFPCWGADLVAVVRRPGAARLVLAPPTTGHDDWCGRLPACRLPGGPGHALLVHGAPWERRAA